MDGKLKVVRVGLDNNQVTVSEVHFIETHFGVSCSRRFAFETTLGQQEFVVLG